MNYKKIIKSIISINLVIIMTITSFAGIVSDSDGTAFTTKQEFENLKKDFERQISDYNDSIDKKIDGAVASYLAGAQAAPKVILKSLLNKINEDCTDSYIDGTTEKKYGYRCMAKEYTIPTTQKPEGAIVNLFFAITKLNGTDPNLVNWYGQWHRLGLTHSSRTGLYDVDVPSSGRKNGQYIMLDKSDNYPGKYYAINKYNDITYRYYASGSGVAATSAGWPPSDSDGSNIDRTWIFPNFEINETEYWKIELGQAACYWDVVGSQTEYDDVNIFYGPSFDATETINVIPVVGQMPSNTVCGLLTSNLTRMRLQDDTYNWSGYGQSAIKEMVSADNPTNKKTFSWTPSTSPNIFFHFNCHPYDSNVKLQDLIDYNATVAYADEEKKTVAIYGGLPIFRATGNGEVTMKIEFMSDLNNDVYVGLSKSQFANNATYTIDSDLNLRNENDVKYTNNKFEHDKEYTFKIDVRKDDVIWIKTYDASNTKGFTGAKTNSIILVEE